MARHLSKICSLASAFLLAACTGTPTTPGDANLDSLVFGQIGDKEVLMAGGNALYFFTRNK